MQEAIQTLTQELCTAWGPSGFEDGIRALIRTHVQDHADTITVDSMGNLIVHKSGKGKKIMIAAHMDEIGFMVNHIDENGFARFTNIGGVRALNLNGTRAQFQDGTIGVIYSEKANDRVKLHGLDKYYIDVGATSKEDCPVKVGDPGVFYHPPLVSGNRLISKAIDDRIGCVIAILALQNLKESDHDITFVFTAQEEVGVRGATVTANRIQPDIGIAIDVTLAGDVPRDGVMDVALGKGPAIKIKDAGMIAHPKLVKLMQQRAKEANIPTQNEVLLAGGTDARAMQLSGMGAAAGCISIPCRYVHSTSETVSSVDVAQCVHLLLELLSKPIDL